MGDTVFVVVTIFDSPDGSDVPSILVAVTVNI